MDKDVLLAEKDAEIAALKARLEDAENRADEVYFAPQVFAFRGYLNKIEGNEHSRVLDVSAQDADEAQAKVLALREDDEVLEQIVSISVSPEHELV